MDARLGQSAAAPAAKAPVPVVPAVPKIRVAVYLSQYCASGADGTQWVYGHSLPDGRWICSTTRRSTSDAAIIEPGTETAENMPKLLDHFFPGAKPADATNPAVLKSFQVIVVPRINYLRDDVRQGHRSGAVRNGTGLLIRNTFGSGVPGYHARDGEAQRL